jgi:group II intron reverse transcriptase/maturase
VQFELTVPTIADRIAQMVVRRRLEPLLEPVFHANSYGYRPGRSAHDALRAARTQCWRHDWVLDIDIKGFFDNIDWNLLMKAVRKHTNCRWVVLYIERWLKAEVLMPDGTVAKRNKGTPQGGVVSPVLANLFLHYAFDLWMGRNFPTVPFERYADDVICHCDSQAEVEALRVALQERLEACQLQLNPEKTRIVYCADANRRDDHETRQFDFLGYTFKPRQARNRRGKLFTSFSPAVGDKAAKAMRREIRGWGLQRLNRYSLSELLARYRPVLAGWVRYYGLFHPSTLHSALRSLDFHLVRWAQRKYKTLRQRRVRAWDWFTRLQQRAPTLFPHWYAAIMATER